jgi:hypothetical protein
MFQRAREITCDYKFSKVNAKGEGRERPTSAGNLSFSTHCPVLSLTLLPDVFLFHPQNLFSILSEFFLIHSLPILFFNSLMSLNYLFSPQ